MTSCKYCNSTILFGGFKEGTLRFCSQSCRRKGLLFVVSEQVPLEVVRREVEAVHQGACPKCQGRGPVDVRNSYRVYSLLLFTRWSTRPQISCRSCGIKSQLVGLFVSTLFGWWGFPWGLIFTPVQIARNLIGLFVAPNPARPSMQLEKLVRLHLASQMIGQGKLNQSS